MAIRRINLILRQRHLLVLAYSSLTLFARRERDPALASIISSRPTRASPEDSSTSALALLLKTGLIREVWFLFPTIHHLERSAEAIDDAVHCSLPELLHGNASGPSPPPLLSARATTATLCEIYTQIASRPELAWLIWLALAQFYDRK